MEDLARKLLLAGALCVLAGAAFAKQSEQLHCKQTKCVYSEEMGPDQTKQYQGFCDGVQMTNQNSSMKCHPVDHMTCTVAYFISGAPKNPYCSCTCTNWSATKRKNATVDVACPASNGVQEHPHREPAAMTEVRSPDGSFVTVTAFVCAPST